MPLGDIPAALAPLFARYRADGHDGEGFGDFCDRTGVDQLVELVPQVRATTSPEGLTLAAHYPVNLVVDGRRVLVVGAGPVAARKVDGLVACGADVTVVALEVCAELDARADVRIERRAYRRGEVAGYWLAFTATDDAATNQAVFDDAEAAGVWANAADDPARCSFTLPAVHRQGTVLLTASSGGRSPALSSWLRGWLEREISPAFAEIAERLAAERAALHEAGCSTEGLDWPARIEQLLAEVAPPYDALPAGPSHQLSQ